MTFQFTHKNYTTSPKSFQAQEHAFFPVLESEGKTLFSVLTYHRHHQIQWFVKNTAIPPLRASATSRRVHGDATVHLRGEGAGGTRVAQTALMVSCCPGEPRVTIRTKLCKPERTWNLPKYRAGGWVALHFFWKNGRNFPFQLHGLLRI